MSRWRKTWYDAVYLYKKGEQTYKMPVWGGDVAKGLDYIVRDPTTAGNVYEFVGPHCYQLSELMDFMYLKAHCLPEFGFRYCQFFLWKVAFLIITQILAYSATLFEFGERKRKFSASEKSRIYIPYNRQTKHVFQCFTR